MEINQEQKTTGDQALTMFMSIRDAEQKNVRTQENDDKAMVNKIYNFIMKKVREIGDEGSEV